MKEEINENANKIKSVTDFLGEAIDAFKGFGNLKDALDSTLPWASVATEGIPFAKLAVNTVEQLTKETHPLQLGLIACTLAYQNATKLAISKINTPVSEKIIINEIKEQLRTIKSTNDVDISNISLESPWAHEFFEIANSNLKVAMLGVGYHESDIEKAVEIVRAEFQKSLKQLLTDPKFEPFKTYINLGANDDAEIKRQFLLHSSYQLWLYKNAPVLGVLPFSLEDVYVDNDCGVLEYTQIKDDEENPFDEESGGRFDLLRTVLNLIKNDEYREAILIQGSAGTGKSSFTLKLFAELLKDGFQPIRIRIRDLNFTSSLDDALAKAIKFTDEKYNYSAPPTNDKLFKKKEIFSEFVSERYRRISKYVLILDGWDEINIADSSFKEKIRFVLEGLKSEYLQRSPLIRVILTGRPTVDIGETSLLSDSTQILTIRNLRPEVLTQYITNLATVVNSEPTQAKMRDGETWRVPELTQFRKIIDDYSKLFDKTLNTNYSEDIDEALSISDDKSNQISPNDNTVLDVLGSPLLAFLSVRLISEWVSKTDSSPLSLIKNPTVLYRHLIDLTTSKAGKYENQKEIEESNQSKFFGLELRHYLHKVASAITVYGKENIPLRELAVRLNLDSKQLQEKAESVEDKNKLSKLLISFFFRTASHLGCEFQHKSFREYLYAEAIVEKLKTYGKKQQELGFIPEERKFYWRDFSEDDLRFDLSRDISDLIASKPITIEIHRFLDNLIEWEIFRSKKQQQINIGLSTLPLELNVWIQIRTALCDLWDWWCSGVHLRPQKILAEKRRGRYEILPPFSHDLATFITPQDEENHFPIYESSQVLDSIIGENLFTLTSLVHGYLALSSNKAFSTDEKLRKYQKSIEGVNKIAFKPSSETDHSFQKTVFRINSNYGEMKFPQSTFMSYIDLSFTDLRNINFSEVKMVNANLEHADLSNANFYKADLTNAKLKNAIFDNTILEGAHISSSSISLENLRNSKFRHLFLNGEIFDYVTVLRLIRDKEEAEREKLNY